MEGQNATSGFCNVTIPKSLLKAEPLSDWEITLDSTPIPAEISQNTTHTSIHITYNHTIHHIAIQGTKAIPEFPYFPILLLFLISTLLTALLYRRKVESKTQVHT